MNYVRFLKVAVIAMFALVLGITAFSASAYAYVDSYFATCSFFQASGTTNAPYVMMYAYNYDTEAEFIEVFPISDGVFDLTITFPAQPEGSAMNYEVWGSPGVDTGSYEWDNEDFFDLDLNCVAAPVDTAPPLPADYVLKSILCDTAVYDTPAGTPVGDGRVSAGQTFFVSPTSETGADGNEWVQVFVSSYTNPYIPAACVA